VAAAVVNAIKARTAAIRLFIGDTPDLFAYGGCAQRLCQMVLNDKTAADFDETVAGAPSCAGCTRLLNNVASISCARDCASRLIHSRL
jgi:hypothetical protein